MGLPLFVAPVESDFPSKAAGKGATSSPGRSGIRRLSRSDSRESRNPVRSASVRIYGAVPPRLPRANQDGLLPWVESPALLDSTLPESTSRQALQEARDAWAGNNSPATTLSNRHSFQHQLQSIFGGDRRERVPMGASQLDRESRDAEGRLGSAGGRSSSGLRRAHIVAPHSSRRLDGSPDRPRPRRGSPSHGYPGLRSGAWSPLTSATANASRAPGPRHGVRQLRSVRNRRITAAIDHVGFDGLGDRDRSPSPEDWDMLLSTLTPDQQQPSAGSSFASTEASQSTGPSSVTPLSLPDTMPQVAEAQCDSGCEHSNVNVDEEDEENVDMAGERSRLRLSLDGRRRVSAYDLDGPIGGHGARGTAEDRGFPSQSPADGSNSPGDGGPRVEGMGGVPRGMPLARLLNRAEGWGGQAAGEEGSEEESGGDGSQPQARRLRHHGNGTLSGEEEWSGMQRIVSSLARREVIPDEWWS